MKYFTEFATIGKPKLDIKRIRANSSGSLPSETNFKQPSNLPSVSDYESLHTYTCFKYMDIILSSNNWDPLNYSFSLHTLPIKLNREELIRNSQSLSQEPPRSFLQFSANICYNRFQGILPPPFLPTFMALR
jgi:hypothetical protein